MSLLNINNRVNDFFSDVSAPICFFDSGIGGLNLLYECVRRLPSKNFIYFADNYNVPYGSFTHEKLINTVDGIFKTVSGYFPCAAVVACNTVTAQCIGFLRKKYSFPIVGIQPAVKPAARNGEKCVILATPATAASADIRELVMHFGNGKTDVVACANLAAYIERNVFSLNETELIKLLPDVNADSVVLGCTHYAYVEETIKKRYNCRVYDGIEGTANRLCDVLGIFDHFHDKNNGIIENLNKNGGKITFIGGDEVKNRRVFEEIVVVRGKALGK